MPTATSKGAAGAHEMTKAVHEKNTGSNSSQDLEIVSEVDRTQCSSGQNTGSRNVEAVIVGNTLGEVEDEGWTPVAPGKVARRGQKRTQGSNLLTDGLESKTDEGG